MEHGERQLAAGRKQLAASESFAFGVIRSLHCVVIHCKR
jgi:hypothetical protein